MSGATTIKSLSGLANMPANKPVGHHMTIKISLHQRPTNNGSFTMDLEGVQWQISNFKNSRKRHSHTKKYCSL